MRELDALHKWKAGGRGKTMMSTFEYKSSHDKMFIEGFREAEAYFEEETVEMRKRYNDLFVQFNQLIGRHEWHDLEIDSKDLPEKAGWYWCKYETGEYGKVQYTGWDADFRDVVAWCNLPEYNGIILKSIKTDADVVAIACGNLPEYGEVEHVESDSSENPSR